MKIQKLIINNFMPYKGEQIIRFPLHSTQNVMLLFGDNMRGKTSFLNSIRWVFYGVAFGRHLRRIPRVNLINVDAINEGDWSMSTVISFLHENKEYEIRRHIEKHNNVIKPKIDADFRENIGMRIDGEAITGDQIVFEINQVIPEEISRFFLFDGELLQEYENLLIEESDQGKKIKEHIEQALGVPALIHARDEIGSLLKEARAGQRRDAKKDNEMKAHAEQQKNLELRLEVLEKDKNQLQQQSNEILEQIDEIDDFLRNTEALQTKQIEIEGLQQRKVHNEDRVKELKEANQQLLKSAWKDVLAASVTGILSSLREKRDGQQLQLKNRIILENEISTLDKSLEENAVCRTCGQGIPEKIKPPLRVQTQELQAQLATAGADVTKISNLTSQIDNLSKIQAEGECRRVIDHLQSITRFNVELTKIENDLEELAVEIRGQDTDEIMRKRDKKIQLEKAGSRIRADMERLDNQIEENNRKQEHISNLILRSQGSKGVLSSKRVALYQELQTVFKEGIDQLRDKLREDVANHATTAFKYLTTEETYSGLEINKNYGLSIIDQEGRTLKERSAGAEQIVALALIDGLNRTARKSGPIIMDTPLGRLDPKHRNNVLRFLPNMAEQVLLLVHEGEIHPDKDIQAIADRIGAKYSINRISATESRIEKGH